MRFEEQDNIVASGEQATPGDAERCTSVDAFLCLLAELSVDDWLAIGDRPPAGGDDGEGSIPAWIEVLEETAPQIPTGAEDQEVHRNRPKVATTIPV